jgi:hypothetical protein
MKISSVVRNWFWAVAIAAAAIIYFAPEAPSAKSALNAADDWVVPRPAPVPNLPLQAAILSASNLWGGQFAPAAPDTTYNTWRLTGVASTNGVKQVLVLQGPDRLLTLKPGDALPDGTKIAEVRNTGICVYIEGKKRFLPLPEQAVPVVW